MCVRACARMCIPVCVCVCVCVHQLQITMVVPRVCYHQFPSTTYANVLTSLVHMAGPCFLVYVTGPCYRSVVAAGAPHDWRRSIFPVQVARPCCHPVLLVHVAGPYPSSMLSLHINGLCYSIVNQSMYVPLVSIS